MSDEKYVDDDLVSRIVEMVNSNDTSNGNLAMGIFDSILCDQNNLDDFMMSFDKLNESSKAKMFMTIYQNINPIMAFKLNKEYIKLCLEHTKWKMNKEKYEQNGFEQTTN